MVNKGGNRGKPNSRRDIDAIKKNINDVDQREANDVHARGRSNNEGRG